MTETDTPLSPAVDDIAESPLSDRIEEQIIRSARSNHQRLPLMEVMFDRFALDLGPVMKSYCSGATAEATLGAFEYMSCGEAQDSLPPSGLAMVSKVLPWESSIGVVLDPNLLFATLEIMLGGRGATQSTWNPRAYSAIEKRLGQRLCQTVLNSLVDAFAQLCEVSFEIERIEGSPQALVLAPPTSPCARITMNISLEDRSGDITFLIPHSAFEEVRPVLAQPFRGGQLGGDSSWRELLTNTLQGTSVTIDALLTEPKLSLTEVLAWQPGQVIDLGIETDHEVTVTCTDLKMFTAAVGRRRNGAVALRITRDYSEKEDPQDVAFD